MSNQSEKNPFTPDGSDDPNQYPPGWDYGKTHRVAEFFDREADGDVVVDPNGPLLEYDPDELIMIEIPAQLLPTVKQLIEERGKKRSA